MQFFRVNKKKIQTLLFIYFVIYPCLLLMLFLKSNDIKTALYLSRTFPIMVGIVVFMVVFIGIINFYQRQRMLQKVIDANVFDEGKYTTTYINEAHYLFLATQQLNGFISGYPVAVTAETATMGREIMLSFKIKRTQGIYKGQDRPEILYLSKMDKWARIINDIPADVNAFVLKMKTKGEEIPDENA